MIAIISSTPTFLLSIQVPFIPSRAPEARSNLSTRRTAKRGKKERNEKKERKKKEKNTVFVSFFHPESIPYHGVSYNTNFIQYLCEQTTRVQCHDTGNIIIITGSFHNVLASIHPSTHPPTRAPGLSSLKGRCIILYVLVTSYRTNIWMGPEGKEGRKVNLIIIVITTISVSE